MIDASVRIIDRIVSLVRSRQDSNRRLVKDHIDPLFKEMTHIHSDYIQSFTSILSELENSDDAEAIVALLRGKKQELEYLRVKVHAYASHAVAESGLPKEANNFFKQCLEYFHAQSGDSYIPDTYVGRFSDLLKMIEEFDTDSNLINSERITVFIASTLKSVLFKVKMQWELLTKAYTSCRVVLLK